MSTDLQVENGVLIGEDGWLFLFDGSNMVSKLFSDPADVLGDNIQAWCSLLKSRKTRLNDIGPTYFHLWAPDKFSVYPEHLPVSFTLNEKTPVQTVLSCQYASGLGEFVIDLTPDFLASKHNHLLYWKTDTHWTYEGAYVAYEALCTAVGAMPLKELRDRPASQMELTLDLGGKLSPKVKEICHFVDVLKNSTITDKNELVRFIEILAPSYQGEIHLGTSVQFDNNLADCDPRTVLIFGDSYCEFRPHSLTALLAETFKRVQFVWSARIDYSLVEKVKPDIVFTECAERFMSRLPVDDLDISTVPYGIICAFLNQKCRSSDDASHRWTFR